MAEEIVKYSEEDLELETNLLEKTVHNLQQPPQTIAIIGQHGCGKSSFINTVMAVFCGEYHERALVGDFGDEGGHVTRRLFRYTKEKYMGKRERMPYNYPTLMDMTGFQNDENVNSVLKLIFHGQIKDGSKLNFQTKSQQNIPEVLQQLNYGDEGHAKVDRIIFVASAKSKEFPAELIKAVLSQASDGTRDIPVFGVLTHADQIHEKNGEEFSEFEKKFRRGLGLSQLRFLHCTNYCDDLPWKNRRNPDVEVPVIRFIRQVIDPAREVYEESTPLGQAFEKLKNTKLKTAVLYFAQCVFILMYLWWLMLPISGIHTACESYKHENHKLSSIDNLCKLSSDGNIIQKPSVYFLFGIFGFIFFGTRSILEIFLRYNTEFNLFLNQTFGMIYRKTIRAN
ncbi:uncharacterized protein LOC133183004 [Saccostrea echinata]|uniref:uncharacterized protein LOC133183004 n=1 Tax=Saccostrea echinata TaxID=191078 RepID=UPI002A810914|nr:uncharacterized protein LOC133183004 [Saccostrea echinata]